MKQCWKTKNSFKQTCSKNPPWLHALLTVYVEIPVAPKTTAINAHFKHVNRISHRVLAWKQYSLDALNYTLCIFEMKYQTNEGKKKKKRWNPSVETGPREHTNWNGSKRARPTSYDSTCSLHPAFQTLPNLSFSLTSSPTPKRARR